MRTVVLSIFLLTLVTCKSRNRTSDPSAVMADLAPLPAPTELFDKSSTLFSDKIHELHIYLRGATFSRVVTHKDQGGEACKSNARYGRVEKLVFKNNVNGETTEIRDTGIRVKGNTSCANFKKQFKFKFNADAVEIENQAGESVFRVSQVFEGDGDDVAYTEEDSKRINKQDFYGLKSIALRVSLNDPTLIREKLSSEVFAFGDEWKRKNQKPGATLAGGAVYRAGFVHLFVHKGGDAEDFGLYDLVELVDKTMFKSRYGKSIKHAFQTNLARGDFRNADLAEADLLTAYEPELQDGDSIPSQDEVDVLKSLRQQGKIEAQLLAAAEQRRTESAREIRKFITTLNGVRSAEGLGQLLDIDNVLNYMVAANLAGHWDSAIGNANNDYLIFNKEVGKWQLFVWDLDNSFGSVATGSSPFNGAWNAGPMEFMRGSTNLLSTQERPLFSKVMQYFGREYRERYAAFLDGVYSFDSLNQRMVQLRDVITSGHNESPEWQALFKFKNHRHAHATCGLQSNKRAVVSNDGWPVYISTERGTPKCQ